jgi:uncharacterized protein DUF6867
LDALLGNSLAVFIGMTIVLFGGAAFMMGQALAETWRPIFQNVAYGIVLGVGRRLLGFLLFQGELLSISGYLVDTAVLIGIAVLAYRLTRARKMVSQYPWLYERSGPLGWRPKNS